MTESFLEMYRVFNALEVLEIQVQGALMDHVPEFSRAQRKAWQVQLARLRHHINGLRGYSQGCRTYKIVGLFPNGMLYERDEYSDSDEELNPLTSFMVDVKTAEDRATWIPQQYQAYVKVQYTRKFIGVRFTVMGWSTREPKPGNRDYGPDVALYRETGQFRELGPSEDDADHEDLF